MKKWPSRSRTLSANRLPTAPNSMRSNALLDVAAACLAAVAHHPSTGVCQLACAPSSVNAPSPEDVPHLRTSTVYRSVARHNHDVTSPKRCGRYMQIYLVAGAPALAPRSPVTAREITEISLRPLQGPDSPSWQQPPTSSPNAPAPPRSHERLPFLLQGDRWPVGRPERWSLVAPPAQRRSSL